MKKASLDLQYFLDLLPRTAAYHITRNLAVVIENCLDI